MKHHHTAALLLTILLLCAACAPTLSGGSVVSYEDTASTAPANNGAPAATQAPVGELVPNTERTTQAEGNDGLFTPHESPGGAMEEHEADIAYMEGYSESSEYYTGQYTPDESYAPITETGFVSPLEKPLSTFSADVDTAAYTNIRRRIENGQAISPDMVRIEEMINYFHYDYPSPIGESPIAITTEVSDCPWNPQHRLALIGLKASDIRAEDAPAASLVFLIDVSGSMDEPNKLPLVKRAFGLLIDELTEKDRVSIVTYASSDAIVLRGAHGDEKSAIHRAIEDLSAGGSTHASGGIVTAYEIARSLFAEGGTNRVILATDGDFNVGATSETELRRMIERERDSGVYLTVLGFGMGNYKDDKVKTLAKHGNGNYAYVDNLQAARKVLIDELGATLHTVAKDVKLQVEFNPATVREYRLIGYENRMMRNEDFRDDTKDAGDIGAGHTVTALYEIIPEGTPATTEALKYQPTVCPPAPAEGIEGEWLTVKLRYKEPQSSVSREIAAVVGGNAYYNVPSDNMLLAGAVAEFGLVLRDSKFGGNATISSVLDALRPLAMVDAYGYVRDAKHLVETYQMTGQIVE